MNKKIIIFGTLIGLILGCLIVILLLQRTELSQIIEQMEIEKSELQDEYEELAIQFDGYQNLDIKNDSLQALLSREQDRVQNLLEELRITKATNAKRIAELKKELATVRSILMTYVQQIDSLNRTNTKLKTENITIRKQNIEIKQQNTVLASQNTQLQETVTRASRLEISDLAITGLNKNDRKTRFIRQMKKVQFDMTIDKNITAPRGDKIVYVRITDPNGELIQNNEDDLFQYENELIGYSAYQVFDYGGEKTRLTVYWTLAYPPIAGYYQADFFIDGELAGSFPFQLHK